MAEFRAVIDAAILAGGLGSRLRPAVDDRPKVLASVAGRPFLSYVLDQVATAGVSTVVLCTGYLGEQVEATFGDRYGGLRLCYSREPEPRGTAGALQLALPLLHSDPVLVLNGDSYCEAALNDFACWHLARAGSRAGSLLLTWVDDTARYGSVDVDTSDAIVSFREKGGQAIPGWINAGVYLLSRSVLMSIPAERAVSIERDIFPAWIGRGLSAYRAKAPFIDIGTPRSYAQADAFFAHRGPAMAARLHTAQRAADEP
jgi:D-glycero-alpha-D-manno-heptose 1-phosphate guanylyltransferase